MRMDDALELSVQDNEFESETPQNAENPWQETNPKIVKTLKLNTNFDPNDYISLSEAKQTLLQNLEQYNLKGDAMLCSRGSVKSRLGIRETQDELMDCSETNDLESCRISAGERSDSSEDYAQTKNITTESSNEADHVQRRPSMRNLCKHLRARWYDNPVKIGKEIAERLEEHKFSLIIETVKIIGGKKTIELFNETKRIQLNGGMKTCSGDRRRTSGGVFLTLLKSSNYATDDQIKKIFKDDKSFTSKEALKRKKAAYNKRKKARKLLEQQAGQSNTDSTKQQDSVTAQVENNAVQTQNGTNESETQDINAEE